ncbi:MAG TPA: twin-arginine translocase subunit TatC [Thermoplasmata archaeon]|nr:twin-arginine translocase subunit TatC [Thermoplasmata archaeon]
MRELQRLLGILGEVRRRVIRIAFVLVPIFAFMITFNLQWTTVTWMGHTVPMVYPQFNLFYNASAQVFRWMSTHMLPSGVQLLNVGVGDSVFIQMEIALLVTLILGMPWIIHEVGAFLVPALRKNERDLLRLIGIPATALFIVGTAIGVFLLTPFTFLLLFKYVAAMGLAPIVGVQDFVTFALLYSLAFGVVFELPIFVYTLTRLGVVKAAAWTKHWRGAVLGALIFGMIITPDNSGITMLLIALPMMALYFGGAYFAARYERKRDRRQAVVPVVGAG